MSVYSGNTVEYSGNAFKKCTTDFLFCWGMTLGCWTGHPIRTSRCDKKHNLNVTAACIKIVVCCCLHTVVILYYYNRNNSSKKHECILKMHPIMFHQNLNVFFCLWIQILINKTLSPENWQNLKGPTTLWKSNIKSLEWLFKAIVNSMTKSQMK